MDMDVGSVCVSAIHASALIFNMASFFAEIFIAIALIPGGGGGGGGTSGQGRRFSYVWGMYIYIYTYRRGNKTKASISGYIQATHTLDHSMIWWSTLAFVESLDLSVQMK